MRVLGGVGVCDCQSSQTAFLKNSERAQHGDQNGDQNTSNYKKNKPTPRPGGCPGGCTEYPTWCEPPIKGNVSIAGKEKIYHVSGQEWYDETNISPEYGERWFCTEDEARAAGWRKARN